MAGIASIGWRLFIWGNQTSEEEYWKQIWEQENNHRAKMFPEQPEEKYLFATIDGINPKPGDMVFCTYKGAEGLFVEVEETLSYARVLRNPGYRVFACKTNAERYREGANKRILRRREEDTKNG